MRLSIFYMFSWKTSSSQKHIKHYTFCTLWVGCALSQTSWSHTTCSALPCLSFWSSSNKLSFISSFYFRFFNTSLHYLSYSVWHYCNNGLLSFTDAHKHTVLYTCMVYSNKDQKEMFLQTPFIPHLVLLCISNQTMRFPGERKWIKVWMRPSAPLVSYFSLDECLPSIWAKLGCTTIMNAKDLIILDRSSMQSLFVFKYTH